MVKSLSIGVIGIQGAVSEHIISMNETLKKKDIVGKVIVIKDKKELNTLDGLLLPGGESTTIAKMLDKTGFYDELLKAINDENLPIMGTCAGCVLLASNISNNNENVKILSAMNMKVKRNAFGRQKESFETNLKIKGFSEPYNAVFIRAPIIEKVWGGCKILSKINNKIVMARQKNQLAISFHPELTNDLRIHEYFLDMIKQ
jgi:5'-phosphate synthase pdxT subunit